MLMRGFNEACRLSLVAADATRAASGVIYTFDLSDRLSLLTHRVDRH